MKIISLDSFSPAILALPEKAKYKKEDLLTPSFLLDEAGDLKIYFAAHNEYVNRKSRILILGLTPGWLQMELSIRLARKLLKNGCPYYETARQLKKECRFAGSMRVHIISMLNDLGLQETIGLSDSSQLFAEHDEVLHTTSLIKFPVFYKGKTTPDTVRLCLHLNCCCITQKPFLHGNLRRWTTLLSSH